jgi:hypothetical protein
LEFPALHETVPVYSGPTVFTASAAAVVNQKTIPAFARDPHLVIKGEIEYQACTSTVCFPPVKAPVEWDVNLRQLDLKRVPEFLQHK